MKEIALLESYFDRLWSICRSITGNGLRESFKIIQEIIPLELIEIPTGTKVLDWLVPKEWNINDAYIITPEGKKIADFKQNNLHVVNYSIPISTKVSFEELSNHLYYREDLPNAVPYVTSYYKEKWGFCISHEEYKKLPRKGKYTVFIDSKLEKGSLTIGEAYLKGESDKEILLTSYLCHPSMANNELSGPLVLAFLYNKLVNMEKRKYSYRFYIGGETIGAISYLSKYGQKLKKNVVGGFVINCCGSKNDIYTYKKTKNINSEINKVTENILQNSNVKYKIIPFDPVGSDERQFCSPGYNIQMGSLMKGKYSEYDEYHTSLDNKDFLSFEEMKNTVDLYFKIIKGLEINDYYIRLNPEGEPNLGKRNLYPNLSCKKQMDDVIIKRMRFLNYSDSKHSVIDICNIFNYCINDCIEEIELLKENKLIKNVSR